MYRSFKTARVCSAHSLLAAVAVWWLETWQNLNSPRSWVYFIGFVLILVLMIHFVNSYWKAWQGVIIIIKVKVKTILFHSRKPRDRAVSAVPWISYSLYTFTLLPWVSEGGIGIFGFAVLDIFLIGFSVFVLKTSVFVFSAVCGFFVF